MIGMAVREEHGLLRSEQRRTASHIHGGQVVRDDESRCESRNGGANEFESGANETKLARSRVSRLREFDPGSWGQGSTVTSVEARIRSGLVPTYLTSKVPGLKGAARERGLPMVV